MRERFVSVWRRVLSLSWPVMVEQTTRTLMRTVDILVTALFSPVAVAAIGLADLYARFPLWVGLGMGSGAIALSSQDTGSGATANRDEAITQALGLGLLVGVPFAVGGVLYGEAAIALLGAPDEVARLGGQYLAIVLATAPARHVALIAARSLQGTGDTRTPMYVNIVANGLNILGSLTLGLGLFGAPRLSIVGVGIATAGANLFTAGVLVVALATDWADANLTRPTDVVVTKQLLRVSAPSVAEGLVSTLAEFPLNAILLGFGTEVNAAFHIGRRLYQQLTGPLSRGFNVGASILVGQSLGAGDPETARFEGWATVALGIGTVGVFGLALAVGARPFVSLFTDDAATVTYAVDFARVYGLTAGFLVTFSVLQGALAGASETRAPFLARTSGMVLFMLGVTYVVGVVLGYGVLGAYFGIGLTYVWMAAVVAGSFHYSGWAERAASMLEARGSVG
ncbi:MATE family efflux transporter [Natronomonas gomsonensis]|uniref:MATE family efflux transporter n=1 Tax=Natronomonas gomsonensis TaxID=1046043 RepID=UPI0015BFDD6F|nr:MATE family efflux transporter [Natronomonas gomsonensis]